MTLLVSALLALAACGSPPAEAPAPEPAAEAPAPAAEEVVADAEDMPAEAPADAAHGAEIVGEKCTSCHTTEVFTRADHKVTSMEQLDGQVEMCGGAAHLSDDDKADVKAYLAGEVYAFGE